MLEKLSPEQKHLSIMTLIESSIWEAIIDKWVRKKDIKWRP